jgi:ABC-2 type transport system permease protein
MTGILATLSRELRAYFFSPLAYVIATFLLLVNGVLFTVIVRYLSDPRYPTGRPLDLFFSMSWLILLFVTPVLTMRLLSEERRSGSIEVLMTAPVTETHVVLGKYLAALLFFGFLWLPTLSYAGIVAAYSELDWGTVAAGYVGVLGIGALALSIGVFASAMTKNQIVAAVVTFALLVGFFFVFGWMENLVTGTAWKEAFAYLDVLGPLEDFAKGIVDTRRVVYYLSTVVFFLFLTTRALAARKWR